MTSPTGMSRRQLLAGMFGVGAAVAVAACERRPADVPVGAAAIAAAEARRPVSGRVRSLRLRAESADIDLGGRVVRTWTYGGQAPAPAIRVGVGDRVLVAFDNALPEATSVHWHGLAIRNDMDGVPGLTTPEVPAGGSFRFDFVVPDAGTYWFHPHSGLSLDRGLYAPFIVDDAAAPGRYDHEWVLVLDDWTDGVGPSPDQIYAQLTAGSSSSSSDMSGMDMSGMDMGGMDMGGMGAGDVVYPLYLVNGRAPNDPDRLTARPGQRVRLRIINAAADTVFTVALAEHALQVTHTDGFPVVPTSADAIQLGMGERYDAIVQLGDGVFPLVAQPLGKPGLARALFRTGAGAPPAATYHPRELTGQVLTAAALRVAPGHALPARQPDQVQDVALSGSMHPYVWTINGRTYDHTVPLTIREGQAGRLRIANHTMMPHPLHVHGHTFQLGPAGGNGPRKDTVLLPAMSAVAVDFAADNPGRWMVHCHNAYHAQAGMMTRLDYQS